MDLTFYKTTELEDLINRKYQENGIYYPSDMNIDVIASIFRAMIEIHSNETKAFWDEEFALIYLNELLSKEQKREASLHEIGHIVLHIGNQSHMPKLFTDLQETQANVFQMYAAMPIYMLEEFKDVPPSSLVKTLAEEFTLTEVLVRRRLNQIENRIYWGQLNHNRREALKSGPIKLPPDYIKQVLADFEKRRKYREEREREGYYAENYS